MSAVDIKAAGSGAAAAIEEVYRLFTEGISEAMERPPIYDNETGTSMAVLDRLAMEEADHP